MPMQLETVQGRLASGKHPRAEGQIRLVVKGQRQGLKVSKAAVVAASRLLIYKFLMMVVLLGLWIVSLVFRVYSLGK